MFMPEQNDPEQIGNYVKDAIQHYKTRAETAEKYAAKTRKEIEEAAEKVQKGEILYLKNKAKLTYGTFDFPQEMEKYQKFNKQHEHCCSTSKANYGRLPYVIPYYTGLGTIFTVVCPICQEKKDITYIEGW